MYRNSASIQSGHIALTGKPSPTPSSDDSDSDITSLLDRKRRELDEEVARFKAAKDQEFQDFGKSLRKQRQKRKRDAKLNDTSSASTAAEKKPGVLSLLAGATKSDQPSKGAINDPTTHTNSVGLPGRARTPPLSKPTISVDRKNIEAQPTAATRCVPVITEKPTEQSSSSPEGPGLVSQASRTKSPKVVEPLTPTEGSHDSFAGVFTPAYLPLLERKRSAESGRGHTPDIRIQRHNSFSYSESNIELVSAISRTHRSNTAPVLPSTSLPSALRTASGSAVRKRKHVTFQLADSAIVEPSSSYEELPSPDPRAEKGDEMMGISEAIVNGKAEKETQPEENEDSGQIPRFGQKQLRSPTIRGRERHTPSDALKIEPTLSPRSLEKTLEQAVDGGSGVGFFELDEEIESPGFGEVRPAEVDDMDDGSGPGEDTRRRGRDDLDLDEEMYSKPTYEYSGSVPINIVKPSGSWVGSFGH